MTDVIELAKARVDRDNERPFMIHGLDSFQGCTQIDGMHRLVQSTEYVDGGNAKIVAKA
ncbi:hypothetical protein URH17368_0747 [Alicyclobacillus hesperidum URH17-3-68]|nr:hypothetical protein URH17368_0747 [Alicyclobacillus hesperidum URH17-3-68]